MLDSIFPGRVYDPDIGVEFLSRYNYPDEVKMLLAMYGGSFVSDGYVYPVIEVTPRTDDNGFNDLSYLFDPYDNVGGQFSIISAVDSYFDMWDGMFLPFGDTGYGDILFVGTTGELKGKIYYWCHDDVYDADGHDKLYLVANSLEDFIKSFIIQVDDEVENFDVSKVTVSMSDDMWRN